ncbi:MAG: 16S rRNA (guanine(966)-N(2))-methyltransferase RsmD [candidate division Zixibacteria bacterium]|nr:16S rRNA (guanine(966)-N(2))-methyltransferase RsmD [candidate division Zixibacteria bacterium]
MSIRITSGEFRGRKIASVNGLSARPTSSAVRNAIFNILGDRIIDANIVDFFCASGTLGIEALSHGARKCCFVENGGKALHVLRENIELLNLKDCSQVYSMNAISSINTLQESGEKFDILFADPPYKKPLAIPLIKSIQGSDIINNGALLVLEMSSRENVKFPSTVNILKSRISGDTAVHFLAFEREG